MAPPTTWENPIKLGNFVLTLVIAIAGFVGSYAGFASHDAVMDTKYDALYKQVEEMRADDKRAEADRKASDVLQASRYAADDVFRVNLLQKMNEMSDRMTKLESSRLH